jgi:hypothetical protein
MIQAQESGLRSVRIGCGWLAAAMIWRLEHSFFSVLLELSVHHVQPHQAVRRVVERLGDGADDLEAE